jgi:lipoprotein-releasing system permease protein
VSLPGEIAVRYFRRRSSRLVSGVSLLAIAGIALGVLSLVVAMGLLSGYRDEVRSKLIGANAEVVVYPLSSDGIERPEVLERRLRLSPRVVATAPVVYWQGMAFSDAAPSGRNVVIKGVDPAAEARVAPIGREIGDLDAIFRPRDGVPGCAVGAELAGRLRLSEGQIFSVAVPDASRRGRGFGLRRRVFRAARLFRTNFFEYDSEWIFTSIASARELAGLSAPANVLEVRLDSIDDTPAATAAIRRLAGDAFTATDWRSLNGSLFSALAIQQVTLFLVIGLIVAVSTFNIVATLVMSVQEKKRDIGVLAAMGAPPAFFPRVFRRLGLLLGGTGIVIGLAAGSLACFLITRFRLVSFPPEIAEIYFVSFVPFLVRARDLAAIAAFSFAVVLAASWLPARRAARLDVAESLRYE